MSTPPAENDSQLDSPPAAISAQPADRSPLVAAAILTIAVCIVYGPATSAPFIFDDKISVVQNASITELWPLWTSSGKPSPLAPAQESVTAGRPLVNLSLALNYRLGKLNPRGYHLVNLALHLMSAMLLWAIVRRTLRLPALAERFASAAGPLALAAALVWALHPLNTEAVEYVSQRTELMMTLFYLATLWASVHYFQVETRVSRGMWLSLATLACLLGMACKEVMVSAPLVVLMFERTFVAGSFARALRRSWPLYLGLTATWSLLFALNYGGPRSNTAGFHLGLPAYVWWLTQSKVLCMYMKLAVWP
ncbi:MAG TPA: hypothetical protein VHV08_14500, partial [Pirellulales bacterium]|nr:hypothetical protein [Pirellulales bacterium]